MVDGKTVGGVKREDVHVVAFEHMINGNEDGIGESTGVEDFSGFLEGGLWALDVSVGDMNDAACAVSIRDKIQSVVNTKH